MKNLLLLISFTFTISPFLCAQTFLPVLSNLDEPNDLVFLGNDMYYIQRHSVNKVDISKSSFTPQLVRTNIARGAGLLIKDGYLYATDFDQGQILKIDITNNDYHTEILIDGLRTPDMMAIHEDILYYTDPNADIIGRVSLTNGNPEMTPLLVDVGRTVGIAIYEDELFYTDQFGRTLNRVNLLDSIPNTEVIFSNFNRPQGLSICGSDIYLSDDLGLTIWKFNPSCGPLELEPVLRGVDTPRQTAIRNNHLYKMTIETENISRINFSNSTCYIDEHIICDSESLTWIDGNTYTSANNTASITLQNSEGCDSIVMLNLAISDINTNIVASNGILTAVEIGASYQWLNCRDGMGRIFRETMSTFEPPFPGHYAVEITKNGCVDTSECIRTSIPTSVIDFNLTSPFEIYPNPTSKFLTIDFEEPSSGNIEIYNLTGQLLQQYQIANSRSFNFSLNEQAGVYLIRVQLGDSSWTERVLKI